MQLKVEKSLTFFKKIKIKYENIEKKMSRGNSIVYGQRTDVGNVMCRVFSALECSDIKWFIYCRIRAC